jgi:enoyl-CoA hydratase/carnithine racemase
MRRTPTRAVTFIQYQDNIMPFTHLDIGGPVATLSLDHAGGNRINFDMRVELREAVQRIEKSPARALLIRGEGDDFCLGR